MDRIAKEAIEWSRVERRSRDSGDRSGNNSRPLSGARSFNSFPLQLDKRRLPFGRRRAARRLTVELTRRREPKHPSPHRASCERRYRRSRPTIYSASLDWESTRSDSSRPTIQAPPTIPPRRSHVKLPQMKRGAEAPPQHTPPFGRQELNHATFATRNCFPQRLNCRDQRQPTLQ
jgi:hypothetical protein